MKIKVFIFNSDTDYECEKQVITLLQTIPTDQSWEEISHEDYGLMLRGLQQYCTENYHKGTKAVVVQEPPSHMASTLIKSGKELAEKAKKAAEEAKKRREERKKKKELKSKEEKKQLLEKLKKELGE